MKKLALTLIFVSHAALGAEDAFKKLDSDGDGSISIEEAAPDGKLVEQFDKLDKDKDGKLNHDEYKRYFHMEHSRRNMH